MLNYLQQNMYTIIVLVILVVIIALIIRNLAKNKSVCSGDCSHCGGCSSVGGSKYKVKTTLKLDGMMCNMCEAHIKQAIRKDFNIRKIKASHSSGEVIIISDHRLDDNRLKEVIRQTGYTLKKAEFELTK